MTLRVDSLRWMASGEQYGDKIPTAQRILRLDPFNFYAHEYIVESYVNLNKYPKAYAYIDSILALPKPNGNVLLSLSYGLKHMPPKDSIYNLYYFKILRNCLKHLEAQEQAAYFLSYTFYRDFIIPFRKDPPTLLKWEIDSTSQYEWDKEMAEELGISFDSLIKRKNIHKHPESVYLHSADSALKYLEILTTLNSDYRHVAQLPLAQLKCHLGQHYNYQLDSALYNSHYLPEWYLGYLPKNWRHDTSVDLFYEIMQNSLGRVDFLSDHLNALNEPVLFPASNQLTYRITWLPSFHRPIVLRLVKRKKDAILYWKVGKGLGGYAPEGIYQKGSETLTAEEFKRFSILLDSSAVCAEDHYDYLSMTDGFSLTVEKSSMEMFCAHQTNTSTRAIKALLLELAQRYFKEVEMGIEDYL